MSCALQRVDVMRFLPLVVAARQLVVATALRREGLPSGHGDELVRGSGMFNRLYVDAPPPWLSRHARVSETIRRSTAIAAGAAQALTWTLTSPIFGAILLCTWLRHGREAMLDRAALCVWPVYAGLIVAQIGLVVAPALLLHRLIAALGRV